MVATEAEAVASFLRIRMASVSRFAAAAVLLLLLLHHRPHFSVSFRLARGYGRHAMPTASQRANECAAKKNPLPPFPTLFSAGFVGLSRCYGHDGERRRQPGQSSSPSSYSSFSGESTPLSLFAWERKGDGNGGGERKRRGTTKGEGGSCLVVCTVDVCISASLFSQATSRTQEERGGEEGGGKGKRGQWLRRRAKQEAGLTGPVAPRRLAIRRCCCCVAEEEEKALFRLGSGCFCREGGGGGGNGGKGGKRMLGLVFSLPLFLLFKHLPFFPASFSSYSPLFPPRGCIFEISWDGRRSE